ncbi:MAG: lamin tail domain-containing protein [Myxococcota bacterium]
MQRVTMVWMGVGLLACQQDTNINRIRTAPEAEITWPEPQSIIRQGEGDILFSAIATDSFDASPNLDLTWTLDDGAETFTTEADTDGQSTLPLNVDGLELGEHKIELVVTDSDDMTATVGLTWLLQGPISAPTVEITAPDDGAFFAPGEEIAFRGIAEDEGTDPDDLDFAWSSDRDGELDGALSGNGESALFIDDLSTGTHEITLTVTDPDDDQAIDTISVSIGDVVDPAEPGDLVFSEMMINPQVVSDEAGEWVELYNTASYAIDVAGYTFKDNDFDTYILEGPLLVAGKDYIVLCADTNPSRNGGVSCDGAFKRATSDALALGNNTDEVILERPDGVVIDQVFYDSRWFTAGVATGLDPDFLDADVNDTNDRWCDQTTVISSGGEPGTPGRENDDCD